MKNNLDLYLKAYEGDIKYDFDNDILLNWYPHRVISLSSHSSSLLELGLGHGYTTNIFYDKVDRHVVLDGSTSIIKNFKDKYPECKPDIIETYFEEFDTDEKFDLIVMGFILEHVDDPIRVLTHFKKFLSTDGTMFISVPNAESLNRRLGNIAGLLPDMESLSHNDFMLGHQRYYTVSTLSDDIEKAGYDIKKMEGIYLKPLTTTQLVSLNMEKNIINALCEVGIPYPELSCGILAQIKPKK